MARFLLEAAVLISVLLLVGCGHAQCHFKYDFSGDGAQYSVCENPDGSFTTTRVSVVITPSK